MPATLLALPLSTMRISEMQKTPCTSCMTEGCGAAGLGLSCQEDAALVGVGAIDPVLVTGVAGMIVAGIVTVDVGLICVM